MGPAARGRTTSDSWHLNHCSEIRLVRWMEGTHDKGHVSGSCAAHPGDGGKLHEHEGTSVRWRGHGHLVQGCIGPGEDLSQVQWEPLEGLGKGTCVSVCLKGPLLLLCGP